MDVRANRHRQYAFFAAMIGVVAVLAELLAQVPPMPPATPLPAPTPLPPPKVSFVLKNRHGHATPSRSSTTHAHTAGGNTDVALPRDDTLIITMGGVATAGPQPTKGSSALMDFDLNQEFEIAVADPKLKKAKLTIEAQVIGLLRGDKFGGSAGVGKGAVTIASGDTPLVSLAIEGHSVGGEENLAINDRKGPISVPVIAGEYHLAQIFGIKATHDRHILGKAAAAEFAPDALDATWISVTDPFRGANKKEFGFRVTLRLEPE